MAKLPECNDRSITNHQPVTVLIFDLSEIMDSEYLSATCDACVEADLNFKATGLASLVIGYPHTSTFKNGVLTIKVHEHEQI